MGGVTRLFKSSPVIQRIQEVAPPPVAQKTSEQMAAEDRSARRRARRGARALLSESRINPEEKATTLGQTGL